MDPARPAHRVHGAKRAPRPPRSARAAISIVAPRQRSRAGAPLSLLASPDGQRDRAPAAHRRRRGRPQRRGCGGCAGDRRTPAWRLPPGGLDWRPGCDADARLFPRRARPASARRGRRRAGPTVAGRGPLARGVPEGGKRRARGLTRGRSRARGGGLGATRCRPRPRLSTPCPTVVALSSSVTARRTRPRSSASPVRSFRRLRKVPASSSSLSPAVTGWNPSDRRHGWGSDSPGLDRPGLPATEMLGYGLPTVAHQASAEGVVEPDLMYREPKRFPIAVKPR
jgi:hypothetical protein